MYTRKRDEILPHTIWINHQIMLIAWNSLTIRPYCPSLLEGYLFIQCPHRANDCKFLLFGQPWSILMLDSIRERRFCVRPYFNISTQHVLFVKLEWFMRWEESCRTAAILLSVTSMISSKQRVALLCSSHLAFSAHVSLASMWCIYTVVLIQPQLGRNPVLFYQVIRFIYDR